MMSKRLTIVISSLITVTAILVSAWAMASTRYDKPLNVNDVKYHQLGGTAKKQVDCLAVNIYREAASEPREGWLAVGMVTMNRLQSGNYASSVCDVVYQKTGRTYQFSWVGIKNLPSVNANLYQDIQALATIIYMNHAKMVDPTKGSTYYHATYVNPGWRGLEKTRQIGQHIFYRSQRDI